MHTRGIAAIAAVVVSGMALVATPAVGAARAGAKCPTVGASDGKLTCKKVGSSNRWVKGAVTTTAPPTTQPPATTAPPTTQAPAGPTTTAPAAIPTTGDAPGVTSSTVKVGFVTVVNRGPGVATAVGDEARQVQAIVDATNAAGGIAGRTIIPVVKEMNVSFTANVVTQSAAICAAMTEDEKVFAVVLQGHAFEADRECYAKKKTLVLDPANFPFSADVFKKLAPYFVSTTNPSIDRFIPPMIAEAKSRGFFTDGTKVALFTFDTPVWKKAVTDIITPELKKAGITLVDVGYSGTDSPQTFFVAAAAAAARFQAKGVDRVVLLGSGGLGAVFALAAEAQKYFPKYLINSNEVPRFMSDIPVGPGTQPLQKGTLSGSMGIGFSPYQDTDDVQRLFPDKTGPETDCIAAYRSKGVFFTSRNNARYALGFCDGISFLQNAGKGLEKNFTIQSVVANAERSSAYDAAGAYKIKFSATQHDGGAGYRVIVFDDTCSRVVDANTGNVKSTSVGCWVFDSPVKDMP